MIYRLVSTATLLLITLFAEAQSTDQNLVRAAFDGYKSSILTDKGSEAVNYVDSKTISYYDKIIGMVKNGDSSQISSMPIIDKITVLALRHRAPHNEIKQMDGKSAFVYAINHGMVGKNSVAGLNIGEVVVDGNFAKGQLEANGQKAPFYFHFYREQNIWKLDLTSLFPISGMAFKKMAEDSGEAENDYLFRLLEMVSGKKPGKEIWNKPE